MGRPWSLPEIETLFCDSDPLPVAIGESAVHAWFGLTYASYLVWPRVLLERMPDEWQRRFVALAQELEAAYDGFIDPNYCVLARDERGRYFVDPLRQYRRPGADVPWPKVS